MIWIVKKTCVRLRYNMQNVCNFPPTFTIVFKLTIFIIEIAVRCTWTLAAVAYFVCSTSELTKLSIPPTIENYTADIWVAFINPLFSITAKKKFLGITYVRQYVCVCIWVCMYIFAITATPFNLDIFLYFFKISL